MPISLKLTAPKGQRVLRGQDYYWSLMMDYAVRGQSFTVDDIFGSSNGAMKGPIRDFARRLTAGGFLAADNPASPTATYSVIQKQSATPKIRADGTVLNGVCKLAAMWNAMRSPSTRTGFTAADLAFLASTDETVVTLATAKRYIGLLAAAGYLILVQKGKTKANGLALWRLAPHMNTGPAYPMALSARIIFDQNRSEIIGDAACEEVKL
ncbi:hypothetical protein J2W92_002298 [Rhizobium leguminosarum]